MNPEHIKRHYFESHRHINPLGIDRGGCVAVPLAVAAVWTAEALTTTFEVTLPRFGGHPG